MKESTALNNISKIAEKINYKRLFIEIETEKDKWTLEKENSRQIGFSTNKSSD